MADLRSNNFILWSNRFMRRSNGFSLCLTIRELNYLLRLLVRLRRKRNMSNSAVCYVLLLDVFYCLINTGYSQYRLLDENYSFDKFPELDPSYLSYQPTRRWDNYDMGSTVPLNVKRTQLQTGPVIEKGKKNCGCGKKPPRNRRIHDQLVSCNKRTGKEPLGGLRKANQKITVNQGPKDVPPLGAYGNDMYLEPPPPYDYALQPHPYPYQPPSFPILRPPSESPFQQAPNQKQPPKLDVSPPKPFKKKRPRRPNRGKRPPKRSRGKRPNRGKPNKGRPSRNKRRRNRKRGRGNGRRGNRRRGKGRRRQGRRRQSRWKLRNLEAGATDPNLEAGATDRDPEADETDPNLEADESDSNLKATTPQSNSKKDLQNTTRSNTNSERFRVQRDVGTARSRAQSGSDPRKIPRNHNEGENSPGLNLGASPSLLITGNVYSKPNLTPSPSKPYKPSGRKNNPSEIYNRNSALKSFKASTELMKINQDFRPRVFATIPFEQLKLRRGTK